MGSQEGDRWPGGLVEEVFMLSPILGPISGPPRVIEELSQAALARGGLRTSVPKRARTYSESCIVFSFIQ
jgi:hypothetical protein